MKQNIFSRVIIERSTGAASRVVIIQCSLFLALSFLVSLITNLEFLSIKLCRVSKNRPVEFSTLTCLHS